MEAPRRWTPYARGPNHWRVTPPRLVDQPRLRRLVELGCLLAGFVWGFVAGLVLAG